MANKVCLIVIDGWGISEIQDGNAIYHAQTPVMDKLAKSEDQYLTLDASGLSVGLPDGLMGNSEVGHMNIGAGRVMYQDIVRINLDVQKKKIFENEIFVDACKRAKELNNGKIHLLGLISDGGVHAHIDHLFSLLEGCKHNNISEVYIHFFSDGRDTSPTSGVNYIKQVLDKTRELKIGTLSTIMGRYYAMDRDKRWDRIKVAFEGLVQGKGEECSEDNVINLVNQRYNRENDRQTDEFLTPIIINKNGLIKDNDTLVFINYRSDRVRQITETFGINLNFETDVVPKNLKLYTMTQYKKEFPFSVLYPPLVPKNVLSEAISNAKMTQFHCAETEKYAHVTFFFNGGQEKEFEGEKRFMVPSPKVATYDLKPEMSVKDVALKLAEEISLGNHPFIMCNFAPPDMVGHTGKYEAAVKAVTATDEAIGIVLDACNKNNYILLITADHGNAEKMFDNKGGPHTAHTTYRVPFCMTGKFKFTKNNSIKDALCDVAPTVLQLLGVEKPVEMTGRSLLA